VIRKILSKILPREAKNYIRSKQNLWFRTIVVWHWKRKGCPVPPPHQVKQMVIEEYQKQYGCSVLVETGNYLGDMVEAQENNFKRIISIELDQHLYERAKHNFRKKSHITIYQGDSSKILPQIMPTITESALFWLDGHYSAGFTAKGDKETPIYEELEVIFQDSTHDHILLVDDARLFTGQSDYQTIEELSDFIRGKNKDYIIEVKDDIIRAVPS
jgi:hypothetical protein